ncbi:MAG: DinB family protein [Gemmataceae bacterium]
MLATPSDALATTLVASQKLFHRYLDDLKPEHFAHQPMPGVNSAAWVVGHLALTDRRMLANRLGVTDLPPLPAGFEERFAATRAAAGTQADLGDSAELVALFDAHRSRLIEAVRAAPVDVLNRPLDAPHPLFATVGEAAGFMAVHTAMHLGQVTVIRRSLGYPPVA